MKSGWKMAFLEAASPIVAVLFSVVAGSVIMLLIHKNPVEVYAVMFKFCLGRADSLGTILFKVTPLLFSGLAVGTALRAGILNIGVEGQYVAGAFLAAWVGFAVKGLPAFIHLPLAIVAGMAGGALWSLVPAILKVKKGAHEVISCIMMNYVAQHLVHYLIADVFMDRMQMPIPGLGSSRVRTPLLLGTAMMPKLHPFLSLFGINLPRHAYVNWFLPVGIVLAIILYYLIWKTPFGFEIRSVGHNATAAEASGIRPSQVRLKVFILSGLIAGLVGLSDLLCYFGYLDVDFPKGYGATGIAVALLGRNNPAGIVAASVLFAFLDRGAEGVQAFVGVPMETIVVLQGVMILSIVVAAEVMGRYVRTLQKREAAQA
ncbi:MAG: ABC transporter permease [Ignavibacteriales bacterium]